MTAKAKRRSRRKILLFSIVGLLVAALTTVAILKKREVPITIQTEKVTRRNITELVVANGKIQPVVQVVINPEVSGEIVDLPVKEGQHVKKGDLLVKIKPDNYRAGRNSSEAFYRSSLAAKIQAEANLLRAEFDFHRAEQLITNALISDSQFLEAKTAFEVMKASYQSSTNQVDQAKASLAKADDDLLKTTILSPMEGTVTRLRSQLGERVVGTALMAGTEIMTIANLEEMEARVDIGEVDVILIALGQTARLEVDAFRDRKFSGKVTEIANAAKGLSSSSYTSSSQPQTDATKFEVKIRIKEKEPFRPGMSVTAEVETRLRTNILTVPIQSVTARRPKPDAKTTNSTICAKSTNDLKGTNAVAVVTLSTNSQTSGSRAEGKKSNEAAKPLEVVFVLEGDHVKMQQVKRGISDDNYVEITDGLQEGVEVVSGGYKAINRELEDGKKVKKGTPEPESDKDKK